MIIIDGKKTAADLRLDLKNEVDNLKKKFNRVPGLTVILIGEYAPSKIYVRNKEKSALEIGLKSEIINILKKWMKRPFWIRFMSLIKMKMFLVFWYNYLFQNTLITKKLLMQLIQLKM